MPTWEITSPDGQTYEIEGESEPTQDELDQMFPAPELSEIGTMPQVEPPKTLGDVLRQPVVRSMPPGTLSQNEILPAIRLIGGKVIPGIQGDTHPDIIDREGIGPKEIDQRGFIGPPGFLDRESAATATGIATSFEPGRLHSTDLSKAQEEVQAPIFQPPTAITSAGAVYSPSGKGPEPSIYEEPTWADKPLAPVGTWIYGKGKLIDQLPPEMRDKEYAKMTMGLSEEIRDNLDALSTPKNLALMGIAKGISLLGSVGRRTVAAGFAYLMGEHAPETLGELKEELSKPKGERDSGKIGTLIGRATIEIGGAVMGGIEAVRPGVVPTTSPTEKVVLEGVAPEAPKPEVPSPEPAKSDVAETPKPETPKHPVDTFFEALDSELYTGPQQKQFATQAGLNARSIDDLDSFVKSRERFVEENKANVKSGNLQKVMQGATKAQLSREALEVATDSGSQTEAGRAPEPPLGTRPLDYKTNPEVAQWFRENAERLEKLGFHVPDDLPKLEPKAPKALESPAPKSEPVLEPAMAGPGTPSVAQPMDPTGTQLAQLTQAIRQQGTSPSEPVSTRISKAIDLAGRIARGKDSVTRTISNAKAASSALMDKYLNLPPWKDFDTSVGRWTGADQQTSHEVRQFQKALNSKVRSRLKQEAMTNWIQADGDEALLRQRANDSSPANRAGYEEALKLSPDEKTMARQISAYLDSRLQEGIDAGLLQQGVDNYVTQVWRKPTTSTQRMWTELFGNDKLNPNFRFARKRIFDSYFEGEQAGYSPRDKRISTLISAYDLAFNKALSARALIRELNKGKAADGQPIVMTSGSGVPVPKGQEPPEAFLIKAHTRPEGAVSADGRPYRVVDHWALRGWKWASKAPTGEPIFVQGDMLVHPDYATKLSRMLKTSGLRQVPVARQLLKAGSLAKQTKLSLSPFHTVQEGLHATAHRVDPTGVVKDLVDIDFSHPEQKALVDHGLMVSDTNAAELFSEGLSGGGIVGKIPGLGRLQQWYTDMTFKDYIPRLKMTMALDALKRNRAAYAKDIAGGKITDDQVLAMTARQSNAAFGEQNYRMMGRSATLQDFLRLSLLAPDFLEARARFVGQALKPYNREQRIALGIMAATLYTTSRMMNKALDDDYHWDKPFSVFYKGREYHLRTILGDVQHMVTDPRGFWYNRLAPITRTISEYVTGRDDRGIKRSSFEQFGDFLQWFKPIPIQVRPGEGIPQAVLGASGVPSRMATSQQQLYQLLDSWRSKQTDPKIKEAYERQRQETHIQSPYGPLRVALLANDIPSARKAYDELLKGRTPKQIALAIRPFSGGYSMNSGKYTPAHRKPMTGSNKTEREFVDSLNAEQRKLYDNAMLERNRVWENFLKMVEQKQP